MGLTIPNTSQSALDELDDIAVDELEPVDSRQKLTDVEEFNLDSLDDEPVGSTSPLAGFASIGAGIVKGASKFYRTLGNWESLIYDKLGVEPGEFGHRLGEAVFGEDTGIEFKPQVPTGIKFADDLDEWYDYVSSKGIKATDSVSKVAKAVYEGVGIAVIDLPIMSKMGLPAFSALTSGGEAIGAGVDDSEIAKSSAIGLAHGMLLHGVLQSAGFLPRGVRLPLVGSIFGGESLRATMEMPPEEREYEQVVADFLIGAGLTFPGKGLSIAELKRTPRVIEAARKLRVEVEEKRILEAMDVAERVKTIRGDELGISGYGEQGRVVVDRENTIRPFEKLSEVERKVVRDANVEQLPPTIGVEGRKPSILSGKVLENSKTGEPIIVDLFRTSEGKTNPSTGAFFGEKKLVEILQPTLGGTIKESRITLKNPLKIHSKSSFIKQLAEEGDMSAKKFIDKNYTINEFGDMSLNKKTRLVEVDSFIAKKARQEGHDGIINDIQMEVQVLNSEAISSIVSLKTDIKIKFIDEEIVEGNKPVEMYEMDIGGVKSDFFVSRAKGESIREKMNEQLELYTDPIQPGEIRNPAAEALANKNFGLQKKLNEQYHEWVRGEVKEKMKKEFKESVVVDGDGNPIKVRQIDKTTFTEDLGNNPVDKFVFLKTKDPVVSVDENGNRTWIINEGDKTVDAFESFLKHREKTIKNQPPPPNISGRDLTFQQLLEILPRRFGGKWPNDKPIVDVFAEMQEPNIPPELISAREQALLDILPDPGAWVAWVKMYSGLKSVVKEGLRKKEKSLSKLRIWVADTGLLMDQYLGPGGGNLFQLMVNGHVVVNELSTVVRDVRPPITEIYKDSKWNPLRKVTVDEAISKALEDRSNAKSYFNNLWKDSGYVEDGFELYKAYRDHLDFMEPKLAARGIKTVDNYMMRVVERQTALDEVVKGIEKNELTGLNDSLRGQVNSQFLMERTGELSEYRSDMLALFDMYNTSVIKTLAFKDAIDYYSKQFKMVKEGKEVTTTQFLDDVPSELKDSKNFPKMRDEVNTWLRANLKPEHLYGWPGSRIMKMRTNIYRTFLTLNVGAALDNSTQKMFTQAMTPREIWPIYAKVYSERRGFKTNAPVLYRLMQEAGKDKTYMLEVSEAELGRFGVDPKATGKKGVRYGMSRVSELDPFFYMERTNWDDAEIAGAVEYLWKKPEWSTVLKKNNENFTKTIEEMLVNNPLYQRQALVSARQLSQQTQIMAGNVASPHIFRTEVGKILGIFKRFKFAQIEQIVRSFQLSGTSGINALRILARGFPDETQHVEALRGIETLRKGLEEVETLARKFPDEVDVDLSVVSTIRANVAIKEKELNELIKRIQPINKNNKASQAALWSRYAAKRMAYNFMWNILANTALDAVGFGVSEQEKKKDPIERAWRSAYRNAIPFLWEVQDPQALVLSPLVPDVGGPFSSKREYYKGMVRWGLNATRYGWMDRLTQRVASDFVVDQTMPIVELLTPGESKKKKKSKL